MSELLDALDQCTDFIRGSWKTAVMNESSIPGMPELKFDSLKQKKEYVDSITLGQNLDIPEIGRFDRAVIATSPIAMETEMGKAPWDMKPMLLNGPKARMSKSGSIYNIIPFRHGVPNNSGENSHFKQMPKDIYAAAKQLKPSVSATIGQKANGKPQMAMMSYGGNISPKTHSCLLSKYPPQTKTIIDRQADGTIKVGMYKHKSSIYDGMVKVQAFYRAKWQSQYMTFRVVSSKSPAYSWWNPGRPGQHHIEAIKDYCPPKVEKRLMEAAKSDLISMVDFNIGMTIVGER